MSSMKAKSPEQFFELVIETPDGDFVAHYTDRGLAALDFPGRAQRPISNSKVPAQIDSWHRITIRALKQALAGRQPDEMPALDLSSGTDFQRRVWNALREITAGHTQSYSEIARTIGQPEAVRAVGGACGANPIPVLVPCHRVLAANHKIGGFSGGLNWKRRLLEREAIKVSDGSEQFVLTGE